MNITVASLASGYTGAGPTAPAFFLGGVASFEISGTFNAATVTLQKLGPDEATWETVGSSTTVTAAAFVQGLNLPAGCYRLSLSGSAGPLYATLKASND